MPPFTSPKKESMNVDDPRWNAAARRSAIGQRLGHDLRVGGKFGLPQRQAGEVVNSRSIFGCLHRPSMIIRRPSPCPPTRRPARTPTNSSPVIYITNPGCRTRRFLWRRHSNVELVQRTDLVVPEFGKYLVGTSGDVIRVHNLGALPERYAAENSCRSY